MTSTDESELMSSNSPFTTRALGGLPRNLRGTKPWTGGSYLTSCGLREWDGILGGGQPIGSTVVLEEDRYSDLCLTLAKYWAAEVRRVEKVLRYPYEPALVLLHYCSTPQVPHQNICVFFVLFA